MFEDYDYWCEDYESDRYRPRYCREHLITSLGPVMMFLDQITPYWPDSHKVWIFIQILIGR